MAEPHLLEHRPGLGIGLQARHAPDVQRHRNVLERAELGQQMMELIHETEALVAQAAALGVAHLAQVPPHQPHRPGARHVQPPEQVQQRALARARCANDGDALAGTDPERYPAQHLDGVRTLPKTLGQIDALEDRSDLLLKKAFTHSVAPPPD